MKERVSYHTYMYIILFSFTREMISHIMNYYHRRMTKQHREIEK